MDFTLQHDFSSLDASEWNSLLSESITDVPFLRHEYLSAWWATRGGGEWPQAELALISTRADGRLIGIAPLFRAEHDGQNALMLLGSIEISDYLDLIVRRDDLPRFLSGLLDFLASDSPSAWSGLDWYNLPDASPTLTVLEAESARRGWRYASEIYRPTPYIPLPGDFEQYLAGIDKKQRHEIRRKMRRAHTRGDVRCYLVEDASTLDAEIEALFGLMARDHQKAGFLTETMRAQMRAAVRAAFAHGWLHLSFLEVNGQKAAASLNFDYGNRLWGYNSGVNPDFIDLSPGWVLLGYLLQWACQHGRQEFDFMRGNEEYKYRFGARDRFVLRARVLRKV